MTYGNLQTKIRALEQLYDSVYRERQRYIYESQVYADQRRALAIKNSEPFTSSDKRVYQQHLSECQRLLKAITEQIDEHRDMLKKLSKD